MIIDTNVSLSRWPFRRLVGDAVPDLVVRLQKQGVVQAWAGSFDGILYKDTAGVNSRLAADCRTFGKNFLVPFGSINPKLPDWSEDVRRCSEEYKMPGIRLHPNYHGYDLSDPAFAELLKVAVAHRLIVQLVLSMEDVRTQHPLVRTPFVDVTPLAHLIRKEPELRLMLLNWAPSLKGRPIEPITEAGKVFLDIATVEGIEGVGRLIQKLSPKTLLFGSNYPLFYFEAARLKVDESGLPESQKSALLNGNAKQLLSQSS
jgi:predicted TIM-barrel fold metal-dependent hydrolase